jgi:hypothetical protein
VIERQCAKPACSQPAVATLTFAYADLQAVLGPLAPDAEPGAYDLCQEHARRATAPRGWELVQLVGPFESRQGKDDMMALVDALGLTDFAGRLPEASAEPAVTRRKGHLAVVADPN